jgi:hypothetical protein
MDCVVHKRNLKREHDKNTGTIQVPVSLSSTKPCNGHLSQRCTTVLNNMTPAHCKATEPNHKITAAHWLAQQEHSKQACNHSRWLCLAQQARAVRSNSETNNKTNTSTGSNTITHNITATPANSHALPKFQATSQQYDKLKGIASN